MAPKGLGRSHARSHEHRHYRWLHAGLIRDVHGVVRDIYFALKRTKNGGMKIIYASNSRGKRFGNYGAAKLKRDLITWDSHHLEKFSNHLTSYGTWQRGHKMRGKALLRTSLLETYQDRSFRDPYPDGKDDGTMGPPLNAIFIEDDFSGPISFAQRYPQEQMTPKSMCHPNSNIPLSTDGIEPEAWKAVHPHKPSAKQVVIDFLIGSLTTNRFAQHDRIQVKRIESAFFELGWRVDGNALREAAEEIKENRLMNAFGSSAWRRGPPLRVDNFKGEDIGLLMKSMKNDAETDDLYDGDHGESDSDSDIEMIDRADPFVPLRCHASPTAGPSTASRIPALGHDEQAALRLAREWQEEEQQSLQRKELAETMRKEDKGYEYLPDDSPEKGKGKAAMKSGIR